MIFYLVRHGQTDWNIEKRMQGHSDVPMNETGLRQIRALADKLAESRISFDRLISSPLVRAKESAELIAKRTGFPGPILFDENFIERDCGLLEGEIWRPELDLDDPKYRMETPAALCERAERALAAYRFSEDERVMIVAHGAILTAVRTVLSDYKISLFDSDAPVIQGNVLCCEKKDGAAAAFYPLF